MAHSRCPHCQVRLKIQDERLHSKVRCPKCSEPFVCKPETVTPTRATARRRPPPKPNSLPIVLACLALLLCGAIWFFYPDPPAPTSTQDSIAVLPPKPASAPPQIAAREHPAMKRVRFFSQSLSARNFESLARQLDLPSWYKAKNPGDSRVYQLLPGDEIRAWEESLFLEISKNPFILQFVQDSFFDVFYLETDEAPLRIEVRINSNPDIRWIFDFLQDGGDWRIAKLDIIPPQAKPVAEAKEPEVKPKESKIYVEDDMGGRIFRGKIVAVDIVQDTSPEDLAILNPLLDSALQDGGLESRVAKKDLIPWENKPIPLLLNRLVELPLDGSEDRLMEVAAIDGLLQALTHRISTLPMRALGTGGKEGLVERQNEVIGSWFTWWKVWGKRWEGWKKEANFPPPPRRRGGKGRNSQ